MIKGKRADCTCTLERPIPCGSIESRTSTQRSKIKSHVVTRYIALFVIIGPEPDIIC